MYSKTCPIPVKNVRDKLIEKTPLSSLLSDCIGLFSTRTSSTIYKNYIKMREEMGQSGQCLLTATENVW
jgi:hypothetical protein